MYFLIWCSALAVLAVVVWSLDASCVLNNICGSTQSFSPDDGHNDARNTLHVEKED